MTIPPVTGIEDVQINSTSERQYCTVVLFRLASFEVHWGLYMQPCLVLGLVLGFKYIEMQRIRKQHLVKHVLDGPTSTYCGQHGPIQIKCYRCNVMTVCVLFSACSALCSFVRNRHSGTLLVYSRNCLENIQ